MKCLGCAEVMVGDRCVCGGTWVAEAKLVEMAQEIKKSLIALAWESRSGTERPCPICAKDMIAVSLVKIDLDRCITHGVWFDAHELEKLMKRARKLPDAPDGTAAHPEKKKSEGGGWEALGAIGELLGALCEIAGGL